MPKSIFEITPADMEEMSTRIVETLRKERAARAAFEAGPTFAAMLGVIRDCPEPRWVDPEEFAYFPERQAAVGWEAYTDEDVRQFIAVVADPDAPGAIANVRDNEADADSPFPTCHFQHYGLHVTMLFGQGTAVIISNDAARQARNSADD